MTTALAERPDIIEAPPLARLNTEQINAEIERLGQVAHLMKAFHQQAIRATMTHDWIDFGGTVYLEGEGALRISANLGLQLSAPVFEEDKGEWIEGELFFACAVEAFWPFTGHREVGLGDCNTTDDFFAGNKQSGPLAKALEKCGHNERLARKLIAGDIRKKAHMNAVSRAVSAVLGLKGLKWDDLRPFGITPENCGNQVKFKSGAKAGGKTTAAGTGTVKLVSIDELHKVALGSVVAVTGELNPNPERFAKFHKFHIKDKLGRAATIIVWSQTELPDFANKGNQVHFASVTVKDYQGNRQYVATEIELQGDAPPPDAAAPVTPAGQSEPGANDEP